MQKSAQFFVILIILNFSSSLLLDCEFEARGWRVIGEVYTCSARPSFDDGNFTHVTAVRGLHLKGFSNDLVKMVQFSKDSFPITSIYQGMTDIFPNFIGFSCVWCSITSLNENDLQGYQSLQFFQLNYSNFTKVPSEFFTFTPKISFIDLSNNAITILGQNFLRPAEFLQELWLEGNPCIDGSGETRGEIAILILFASIQCPDPDATTTTTTMGTDIIPTPTTTTIKPDRTTSGGKEPPLPPTTTVRDENEKTTQVVCNMTETEDEEESTTEMRVETTTKGTSRSARFTARISVIFVAFLTRKINQINF